MDPSHKIMQQFVAMLVQQEPIVYDRIWAALSENSEIEWTYPIFTLCGPRGRTMIPGRTEAHA